MCINRKKNFKIWLIFTLFYYFETITNLQSFTGKNFPPGPFENEFAYLIPIIPENFNAHFL